MKRIGISIILCLLLSVSCSDLIVEPNKSNENVEDFNVAWQTINEVYPYFEFKNIDWDAIYPVYKTGSSPKCVPRRILEGKNE